MGFVQVENYADQAEFFYQITHHGEFFPPITHHVKRSKYVANFYLIDPKIVVKNRTLPTT